MGNNKQMPPPPPPMPEKPEVRTAPPPPSVEIKGSGALPATKLTHEQLLAMRAKRNVHSRWANILRNITLVLAVLFAGGFAWLQADLLPSNPIFPIFGLEENIGRRAETLKNNKTYLKNQITAERQKADDYEERLDTQNYTVHTSTINALRNQQLQWFDSVDEDGKVVFGMMDALSRLEDYFNDSTYFEDPQKILQGRPGQIHVESLSATRDGVTFSAVGSEIFGRVFFLNIEFLQLANSFPFFKDGELYSFGKARNRNGDDEMTFSVQLKRQKDGEEDPADARFAEYLEWLRKIKNTKS